MRWRARAARHRRPTLSLAALVGLGPLLSAFMNNVGAMALLMPVACRLAIRLELPPGQVLMPLAFGTILGGMTTLIGTPPNLIVSGFRAESGSDTFGMFDFTPGRAGGRFGRRGLRRRWSAGGWCRAREQADPEGFESGAYLTEARVAKKSKVVGRRCARSSGARRGRRAGGRAWSAARCACRAPPRRRCAPATS
jgi:hypothetical protein